MNLDTLAIVVFIIAVAFAAIAGAFSYFRTPGPYIAIAKAVWEDAFPLLREYILRRNAPKVEEKMHDATRRAQEWDNFNKRPRDK